MANSSTACAPRCGNMASRRTNSRPARLPGGPFYGRPALDRFGLKLARHYGQPELPNPDGVNWNPEPTDEPPVREFLNAYVSAPIGPMTKSQVCMYTLTPDKHFVIDVH